MGKWATYRRRGSIAGQAAGIPAPPTPVMSYDETYGLSSLQVPSHESGNTVSLWGKYGGDPVFEVKITGAWATRIIWADYGDTTAGQYYVIAHGNGTDFAGDSEPSNTVTVI